MMRSQFFNQTGRHCAINSAILIVMHWLEKFLLPPSCQLCGAPAIDDELCPTCASKAKVIVSACPLCALPNDDGSVCFECAIQPPAWQAAYSCLVYDGSVQQLIVKWKYQRHHSSARLLCETLAGWLSLQVTKPDATAIIPIPMHRKKLRARGFNTAYMLAQAASQAIALPLLDKALIRRLHTPAQAGLDKAQRQQNLAGAFQLLPEHLYGYERIILVDDVYTTGTTLSICTQLLRDAGVKHVTILTLARTLAQQRDVF
jgi:ComF family protein